MKGRTGASAVTAGLLGVGCLAVGGAGVGIAVAASGSATIHACEAKSNGAVRVVTSAKDCTTHEKAIAWNERGARGPKGATGKAATFQMYANVDQMGDLGSHYGATAAAAQNFSASGTTYTVTFNKPIGSCAALVQPGKAGGNITVAAVASEATPDGDDAFDVSFPDAEGDGYYQTSFMITVTCAA